LIRVEITEKEIEIGSVGISICKRYVFRGLKGSLRAKFVIIFSNKISEQM